MLGDAGAEENVDTRDNVLYHPTYSQTAAGSAATGQPGTGEVPMAYEPRHLASTTKSRSKHWRHRILVAATVAAGSLLLAAPAFAGPHLKFHW
jgi:hypothetical protein